MGEYRLIDEAVPSSKPPWSPRALFWFTLLGGSLFGGVLAWINCGRLGRPDLRLKTLGVALAATLIPLAFLIASLATLGGWGSEQVEDVGRLVRMVAKFIAAFYFLLSQRDTFALHLYHGGRKASVLWPVLVVVGLVLLALLVRFALAAATPS
jgi:hypothetical protein